MTVEKIRDLCHTQPFSSFTLHMPDGRRIPVEHPDYVAFAPSGRRLVVFQPDDSHNIVDVMLVSDVSVRSKRRGPTVK